ncbi:MAG: hypothetical protein JF615_16115 [Asticcacaulis sp.]|nr:hypothetical protein [Asticcacaulis sp.]
METPRLITAPATLDDGGMLTRRPKLSLPLACAALILASAPTHAADAPIGQQAASAGFVVMQIATTDPDKLIDNWGKGEEGVRIESASVMKRNQPIAAFILFSGCRPNADGLCNVTADFETLAPNGAVYDKQTGVKVWVDRPAPPAMSIGLSEDGLGLRIEDKEALGGYVVRATVVDHNSGVTLQTTQTLTAVD